MKYKHIVFAVGTVALIAGCELGKGPNKGNDFNPSDFSQDMIPFDIEDSAVTTPYIRAELISDQDGLYMQFNGKSDPKSVRKDLERCRYTLNELQIAAGRLSTSTTFINTKGKSAGNRDSDMGYFIVDSKGRIISPSMKLLSGASESQKQQDDNCKSELPGQHYIAMQQRLHEKRQKQVEKALSVYDQIVELSGFNVANPDAVREERKSIEMIDVTNFGPSDRILDRVWHEFVLPLSSDDVNIDDRVKLLKAMIQIDTQRKQEELSKIEARKSKINEYNSILSQLSSQDPDSGSMQLAIGENGEWRALFLGDIWIDPFADELVERAIEEAKARLEAIKQQRQASANTETNNQSSSTSTQDMLAPASEDSFTHDELKSRSEAAASGWRQQ